MGQTLDCEIIEILKIHVNLMKNYAFCCFLTNIWIFLPIFLQFS